MSNKTTLNEKIIDEENYNTEDLEQFKVLLEQENSESSVLSAMAPGNIIEGTVISISSDFVVIDVSLKSEGLVPISEFQSEEIEAGSKVEVFVEKIEGDDGQIVLSREKARIQRCWETIIQSCSEGSVVTGTVTRKVKGGLIVDIGIETFLPGSQVDHKRVKVDDLLGKTFSFEIIKINQERRNIVVSRRKMLDKERSSKRKKVLDALQENTLVQGVVKNITDFGVFLDLNGIDGLLHITDMTWKRIKHPSEMVKIGDLLEVLILSIDKEKGRVALGLKQKDGNPWSKIEEKYLPNTVVKGKVLNIVSYGAFVEIEDGIEGLIHASEISWTENKNPSEVFTVGEEVEAMVLEVHKEGKISLGLKQLQDNPWDSIEEAHPVGSAVKAKITHLTNYGAFAEVEPYNINALIHISDLSWTKKVSHPSEIVAENDIVDAVVLTVDKQNRKMTLGIKQLQDNPWDKIVESLSIGSVVSGKVVKTAAFGVFIMLDSGIEAFIHVNELSDQSFAKVEDVLSVGDNITAIVIGLDPVKKNISLSLKQYLEQQNSVSRDDIVMEEPKESDEPTEEGDNANK